MFSWKNHISSCNVKVKKKLYYKNIGNFSQEYLIYALARHAGFRCVFILLLNQNT